MAAKQPRRKAAKGHKLPDPFPEGKEITDTQKKTWIINKIIGSGGFGTVYFASDSKKPKDFDYVVKVEYHENGPLFAEMHCYQKIAKPADLSDWVKKKKLDYLGLSPCHGFGSFEHNGSKYRFMVLERFGKDLQKLLEENERTFPLKTVCLIGLSVIDVLEYIHSCGYIHGDVKAANLLMGRKKGTENQVYLVDMGLACKYLKDDVHKKDQPDPRKAHNGTPEFTSRDAHRGSFSRRSDFEILAYNLLQWLSGRLPWEDFITDNNKLQKEKERYMANIDDFLKVMFHGRKCPSGISKFLHYVNDLTFEQDPDYNYCKKLFKDDLKSIGCSISDHVLDFTKTKKKPVKVTPVPVNSANEQSSNKENGKQKPVPKRTQVKRKAKEEIQFDDGMVLTPAMQAVLNKKQSDAKPKSRKK